MEKVERDGEGGRQFLVLHQELHPDAISGIASESESHNLSYFFFFFFFSGGHCSTSSFAT